MGGRFNGQNNRVSKPHALVHRAARRPTKGFAADARSAAALLRWRLQPARGGGRAGISEARAAEESAHAATSRAAAAAKKKKELTVPHGASAERLEKGLDDEGQGKGGRGGVGSDSHSGICHGKTKCKYA